MSIIKSVNSLNVDEIKKTNARYGGGLLPFRSRGTLPSVSTTIHPALVSIFIDAQYDYIEGRMCSLGALVVRHVGGEPVSWQHVIRVADFPPTAQVEKHLFRDFVSEIFSAISTNGSEAFREYGRDNSWNAPLHLTYFDRARTILLEGLTRLLTGTDDSHDAGLPILNQTLSAFYDLLAQEGEREDTKAMTCLATELARFDLPIVCPSLQGVASHLGYRFSRDIRRTFYTGHFDSLGHDAKKGFYTRRARYSSQIPLEYFYAAWDSLPSASRSGTFDPYMRYRKATPELLEKLIRERLDAMHHITGQWTKRHQVNSRLRKSSLRLDQLASRNDCAKSLADGLSAYLLAERHTRLSEWKEVRLQPPVVRRALGECLIGTYRGSGQTGETQRMNGIHIERVNQGERWNHEGMNVCLQLAFDDRGEANFSPERVLLLSGIEPGSRVLITPCLVCDERLPPEERMWREPTPNQMLYSSRADVQSLVVHRNDVGVVTGADIHLIMRTIWGASGSEFVFPTSGSLPFAEGEDYTIDPCPSDSYLMSQMGVVGHIWETCSGLKEGRHVLYERFAALAGDGISPNTMNGVQDTPVWSEIAAEAQARFMSGLQFFARDGVLKEEYDAIDRAYIGGRGEDRLLLIQGPPGTAKTSKTCWAILARLQGAIVAGQNSRIVATANTHSAADVLLQKLVAARATLFRLRNTDQEAFANFFDARLLDVTLFRASPMRAVPDEVVPLLRAKNKGTREEEGNADKVRRASSCVTIGTPGGIYGLYKDRWMTKSFLHRHGYGVMVVDEASRVTVPEILLCGVCLAPGGQVIAVGDHRQLAPVQVHDWRNEHRRTFQHYDVNNSAFEYLLKRSGSRGNVPVLRFDHSFRCPKSVAAFLNEAVYANDGIEFYSVREDKLCLATTGDEYVDTVLHPDIPIVVVLHDENESQTENAVERALIAPLLHALTDPSHHNLDAITGVGVVAVHRHQRASLCAEHPRLASAINTVEKFQGDEREVVIISATESDPYYLREAGEFLLDLRRLCVAVSRAKKKVVLIASRSIFQSTNVVDDEERWKASLVWQKLLRRYCTDHLWSGEEAGHHVSIWGNASAS